MLKRPVKILLVCDDVAAAERLQQTIEAVVGDGTVTAERLDAAVGQPVDAPYDLILLDIDAAGEDWGAAITMLRLQMPQVPLIAVGDCPQENQAAQALHAGAQDCLSRAEGKGPVLARAIRHACERSRYQWNLDETGEQRSHDREIGGLSTISRRAPLPITERSFGSRLLADRETTDFNDLIQCYGELLDRALLGTTAADRARIARNLQAVADRLGVLGAGPRDAVDLHKAAMINRLQGRSARKNRAYVEEGRLLLVQLMGYLVSYYRHLSWDGRSEQRLSSRVRQADSVDAGKIAR